MTLQAKIGPKCIEKDGMIYWLRKAGILPFRDYFLVKIDDGRDWKFPALKICQFFPIFEAVGGFDEFGKIRSEANSHESDNEHKRYYFFVYPICNFRLRVIRIVAENSS